ncbi:ABC transporter ATP-binding protein [Cumulibacter soli]|uniref:ABC transporter ATP-binding protein n=1 Tax=Cumulibacter soli TaxID=2546344 RepID=UPI00106851BE|nr:ABC transporter ATP-binding protein [Cumulibacter soli]
MSTLLESRETATTQAPPSSFTLDVRDLTTTFRTRHGETSAVNGVSFTLEPAKTLAVIGESGSGKSAMLRSIIGINPPSALITGELVMGDRDLLSLGAKERRSVRGRDISMVFQDPLTALDPVYTVGEQLIETIGKANPDMAKGERSARALDLLNLVQIPSPQTRLKAYPSQLSGGMRQRIVIAMAIAGRPQVLLADEPTTALDVTVQARIIRLFRQLQIENQMSIVVVTHDLGVAAELADDVAVMYAGRFVEFGTAEQVLNSPAHPYTEGLIEANVRAGQPDRPMAIGGMPPSLQRIPPGCAFAPRCRYASASCWSGYPQAQHQDDGHWSRCVFAPGQPTD